MSFEPKPEDQNSQNNPENSQNYKKEVLIKNYETIQLMKTQMEEFYPGFVIDEDAIDYYDDGTIESLVLNNPNVREKGISYILFSPEHDGVDRHYMAMDEMGECVGEANTIHTLFDMTTGKVEYSIDTDDLLSSIFKVPKKVENPEPEMDSIPLSPRQIEHLNEVIATVSNLYPDARIENPNQEGASNFNVIVTFYAKEGLEFQYDPFQEEFIYHTNDNKIIILSDFNKFNYIINAFNQDNPILNPEAKKLVETLTKFIADVSKHFPEFDNFSVEDGFVEGTSTITVTSEKLYGKLWYDIQFGSIDFENGDIFESAMDVESLRSKVSDSYKNATLDNPDVIGHINSTLEAVELNKNKRELINQHINSTPYDELEPVYRDYLDFQESIIKDHPEFSKFSFQLIDDEIVCFKAINPKNNDEVGYRILDGDKYYSPEEKYYLIYDELNKDTQINADSIPELFIKKEKLIQENINKQRDQLGKLFDD